MMNYAKDKNAWESQMTLNSGACLGECIASMRAQEETNYLYRSYLRRPDPANEAQPDIANNPSWREQICHWSFSVVDHFELSRETVAVCVNLFDRYVATQGNRCTASTALLISLTTLYIAIKVHEPKKMKLSTLAGLSRDQFKPLEIEEMEVKILMALSWRVNPPTVVGYISHMIQFMFPHVHPSVRRDIFEVSRYLAELSVCDRFFVDFRPSTVAYAAVLNVMESMCYSRLPPAHRSSFIRALAVEAKLDHRAPDVLSAQKKLKEKYSASMGYHMQQGGGKSVLDNNNKHGFAMQPANHDDIAPCHGGRTRKEDSISSDNSIGSVKSRFSASPRRAAVACVSPCTANAKKSMRCH